MICSLRGAERLLDSLLPATWPSRAAVVGAARLLDDRHDGDAAGQLLRSWALWRRTGALPSSAIERDLLQQIGLLCGGIAREMRYRPRLTEARPAGGSP